MSRKQQRAQARIKEAKRRKQSNFTDFVYKIAKRRLEKVADRRALKVNFHCLPASLKMPRDEFLSKGQQLVGGAGILFGRGDLAKVIPNWSCQNREKPTILIAAYVQHHYDEDGKLRSTYDTPITSASSGSWASNTSW